MKLSINERGQLVVSRTVEEVKTFDVRTKRKELRASIDSKKEVIESLQEELKEERAMIKWINENTKEEKEDLSEV